MLWVVLALVIAVALGSWLGRRKQAQSSRLPHRSFNSTTPPPTDGPTLEEPWRGRQWRPTDDPNDRPNSGKTWDEVFNRQVTDELHFRIEYADRDGVVTTREIRPISIHLIRSEAFVYIKAFCVDRNEERTFHSDRILSARNLKTNRNITDLGQYLRGKF